MKKKITLLALAFASLNVFALEANVKVGYDFLRNHNKSGQFNFADNKVVKNEQGIPTSIEGTRDGRGFKIGAEVFPYTNKKVDLGFGIEYNFGEKSLAMENSFKASLEHSGDKFNFDLTEKKYIIPVYAVSHFDIYKKNDATVYLVNRFGGAAYKRQFHTVASMELPDGIGEEAKQRSEKIIKKANKKIEEIEKNAKFMAGLYYAAGLGFEYKNFIGELLYDGAFIPKEEEDNQKLQHKFGISLGYKFDKLFKKAPMVKEEVVAPVVEEVVAPVVEEVVAPVVEEVVAPVVEEVVVPVEVVTPAEDEIVVEKVEEVVTPEVNEVSGTYNVFGYNVDSVKPINKEIASIKNLVAEVNRFNSGKLEVIGHADSTGSMQYNQKLSEKRAMAVANLLKEYGLNKGIEVSTKGEGETNPIDTNETKEGRYRNRRVLLNFTHLK
ncbi:OmpA family protein [Oceanivirga miroungae]|uniref:Outer membrane fibronectin-binding protein n=1 Tax=Oceanivirga miroungae TaxID=1130046 RepID=A0A6I8MC70_9FUSO|nr:OmpA family protein [Oceanivirga miroungae]VWL85051.1 outer membrane fibronectin-binding protein [Oceanivirga miroungae]